MKKLNKSSHDGVYSLDVAKAMNPDFSVEGKIALVDADLLDGGTRHPNLVIMKLSGYFKERGNYVELIENMDRLTYLGYQGAKNYAAIFISKVFTFTKIDEGLLELDNVYFGGTGFFFDYAPNLPYEIEHHMPDYHIYDNFIAHDNKHKQKNYWKDYQDYSIGFATRGCFRHCKFCVNHKYNKVCLHSHISEWYDPTRKYIYLWDDNIFGFAGWREIFQELAAIGKAFQFRQGLDIRLLTEEHARVLNLAKYHGDIIFAFDNLKDKDIIEKKLTLWRTYSPKETKLYVLVAFESLDENEVSSAFERVKVIMKYGCLPFIMKHENYLKSEFKDMFTQIARWCNQPNIFKKMSFREFCIRSQAVSINRDKKCLTLRTMLNFEDRFPEIAKKYFDMKYSEQEYVIEKRNRKRKQNIKVGDQLLL